MWRGLQNRWLHSDSSDSGAVGYQASAKQICGHLQLKSTIEECGANACVFKCELNNSRGFKRWRPCLLLAERSVVCRSDGSFYIYCYFQALFFMQPEPGMTGSVGIIAACLAESDALHSVCHFSSGSPIFFICGFFWGFFWSGDVYFPSRSICLYCCMTDL